MKVLFNVCHHSKRGKMIRKMHHVIAISYLTNTDILMIKQATCAILPLLRALALGWGHITLGQLMKFPHSLMV